MISSWDLSEGSLGIGIEAEVVAAVIAVTQMVRLLLGLGTETSIRTVSPHSQLQVSP